MGETEKRKNKRVEFHTTVTASFDNNLYEKYEIKDLSTGGVFIYDITGQKEGNSCDLTLRLTGTSEDIVVWVKGEVVRVTREGIGINFNEIDIDSLVHLRNIVYYNNPDTDQMDEGDLSWTLPRNH
ncbi:MAG: PilZ domain-containing protein [Thermodesulfobacteriota bacterium]